MLEKMKNKWWNEVGTGICATKEDAPDATPLAMDNLAGVFLVLLVGSCCALLYGAISWVLFTIKKARHYHVSYHHVMFSTKTLLKRRIAGAAQGGAEGGVPVSYRLQQLYTSSQKFGFNLFPQSAIFDVCWFYQAGVKLKIVIFIKSFVIRNGMLKKPFRILLKYYCKLCKIL